MNTEKMPHDKGLDHTLEVLLKEGYEYILNKRKELDSDVFDTRLLGQKTICLSGENAAKLFYNNEKFKRDGAMPSRVLNTLFGQDGVQTFDGEAHDHRKKMFMPLLSKEVIQDFSKISNKQWENAIERWQGQEKIVLYKEVQEILTRTVCEWVGVPVEEKDYPALATDLSNMFEAASKVGPAHHAGKKSRKEREQWLIDIVHNVREQKLAVPSEKALYKFVWAKDLGGELLTEEIVAVELLNLLRPVVAVAVYINFVALSLHDFPEQLEKVQQGGETYREMYVQEVRRYYPFFPFAGARVKKDFEWEGYLFEEDKLTLLDLYGTNHDSTIWTHPYEFNPERFENRGENPYDFIPQGGGDYLTGHRCPGEWVTVELMKVALDFLANRMDYELPSQDFTYSLTDMPSLPKDQVIMKNISKKTNN